MREQAYSFDQWRADATSGRLRGAFACGTAAVITPIREVRSASGDFTIPVGDAGSVTQQLKAALTGIQRGESNDHYGWVHRVAMD